MADMNKVYEDLMIIKLYIQEIREKSIYLASFRLSHVLKKPQMWRES